MSAPEIPKKALYWPFRAKNQLGNLQSADRMTATNSENLFWEFCELYYEHWIPSPKKQSFLIMRRHSRSFHLGSMMSSICYWTTSQEINHHSRVVAEEKSAWELTRGNGRHATPQGGKVLGHWIQPEKASSRTQLRCVIYWVVPAELLCLSQSRVRSCCQKQLCTLSLEGGAGIPNPTPRCVPFHSASCRTYNSSPSGSSCGEIRVMTQHCCPAPYWVRTARALCPQALCLGPLEGSEWSSFAHTLSSFGP